MKPFANHHEKIKDHSFLVTGGAGFIGSHIAEFLLNHGASRVVVLDNLSTGFLRNVKLFDADLRYHFIEGDICDPDTCLRACEGIDFVFHEAALGSVPRSMKDPVTTHKTNVNGFLNMLVAARDQQVKRFVYASSSSVFGDSPVLPKSEENIGNPLSPYAVTKRVNELYGHVFALTYEMEIIGLRYFNIFGPRQHPGGPYAAAIPLFINALLKNESPVIFGDGEQSRDFTFVDNAVQANMLAMFSPSGSARGEVFNIAVGECITVNDLFKVLRACAGSGLLPNHVAERTGDIRHSLADISKASQSLGYAPQVHVQEGLRRTWEWFVQNQQNLDL